MAPRRFLVWLIATVCGSGHAPIAPGTAGSIVAACLWWLLPTNAAVHAATLAAWMIAGVLASGAYAKQLEDKDPSRVVVDEAAGVWIALIGLPKDLFTVGIAVILFRFFDVIKPFGIRRLERWPGGWGIMADDVAAGAAVRILLGSVSALIVYKSTV